MINNIYFLVNLKVISYYDLKMSVIKAILFYSKHDQKSSRMKQVVDSINIDLDTVSVDNPDVKELLLNDEEYGITEVPAVLIIYSSGQHVTHLGKNVDKWFEQLLQNIQAMQQQEAAAAADYEPVTPISTNVPKVLRRSGVQVEPRTTLAPPGRPLQGEETLISFDEDPHITPKRKEVKNAGLSPREIAEQMARHREEFEDEIEQKRKMQLDNEFA